MSAVHDMVVSSLEEAVQATLAGRRVEAEKALTGIVVSRPSLDTSTLLRQPAEAHLAKRKSVSPATQLLIYRRDNFTCRYCGRQTLFTPLVRLLSSLYPATFPYHKNWKLGACHLLYWTHTVSLEHVIPVAAGGTNEPNNLVTTCYWCNDWKTHWTLEQLGWTLHPSTTTSWDGLSQHYSALYEMSRQVRGTTAEPYFGQWLRALTHAIAKSAI